MKRLLLIASLVTCLGSRSQTIKVGEKYPDITLNNVLNYKTKTLKVSEFKGKLVILDFWSTGCTACIMAFSSLDSLQQQFRDRIQIILVNRESTDSTLRFFSKRKKIIVPEVPLITNDKRLSYFFPRDSFPYTVWIDTNKVVRYFTNGYNTTSKNISSFISGSRINLKDISTDKKRIYGSIISRGDTVIESQYEYYSYITKCKTGIDVGHADGMKINSGKSVRLSSNCSSIIELYRKAYKDGDRRKLNLKQSIILNVSDTFKYVRPHDYNLLDLWTSEYAFNYDLVLPGNKAYNIYDAMRQDLDRYFNLKVKIEKRIVRSIVLIEKKYEDSSNKGTTGLVSNYILKNGSTGEMADFIRDMIENNLDIPFFDETNSSGSISIKFREDSISPFDFIKFREDIRKCNFDLVESDREIEVLIISD